MPSRATDLVLEYEPVVRGALAPVLAEKIARAAQAADEAVPDSTRAAYDYWLGRWSAWATAHGVPSVPAPADAFAAYLTELVEVGLPGKRRGPRPVRPASLAVACAAVATAHHAQGLASPTDHKAVRLVIKGLRRRKGMKPRRVQAMVVPLLARVIPQGDRLIDIRDRALLLVGWAGALRRSELVALDVEHIRFMEPGNEVGALLDLGCTKTDQQGTDGDQPLYPAEIDPALCPIAALRAWLAAANITTGPVFRAIDRHGTLRARLTAHAVATIIKRQVKRAGLDPKAFSGHSLRRGMITQAYRERRPERDIVQHSRHSPRGNTVRVYFDDDDRLRHNAARGLL